MMQLLRKRKRWIMMIILLKIVTKMIRNTPMKINIKAIINMNINQKKIKQTTLILLIKIKKKIMIRVNRKSKKIIHMIRIKINTKMIRNTPMKINRKMMIVTLIKIVPKKAMKIVLPHVNK